jgi:hypothetical protein
MWTERQVHSRPVSGYLLGTLPLSISLTELVDMSEHDKRMHAPRSRPPESPLEWLGLAVGEMPFLSSSARLVDDLNWHSHAPNAAQMHARIIDSLSLQLAGTAAVVHGGLDAYLQRQPAMGTLDEALGDVDVLSQALFEDHPLLSRRSEMLIGGFASALAAAIQAAGQLNDAELAILAGDAAPDPELIAAVAYDAITRALATLLGHARLNARDREFVISRAGD